MNKMQAQVEEFHSAFDLPVGTKLLSDKDAALRLKLIVEESAEGFEALNELASGDPVPLIDLYCDLLYFVFGGAVALGVNLEPFFDAIHQANMAKLWDGEPKYRSDGKVIKPPDWKPANLRALWEETYGTV